jgi:GNAT superfamily N-acetyltransferase
MKTLREMMDLIEAAQQGVAEDAYENAYRQRWAQFKPDGEEQSGGMILRWQKLRSGMILVQARSGDGSKELGSVEFRQYDPSSKKWTGEALHVDPRYRRQGVATAMYDWFKRRFGPIRPSDAQTQDGEGFWRGKKVWEQDVAAGFLNESAYEEAWELISQPVPEIQQFVKQLGLSQDDTTANRIAPMIDATPDTQLPAASIPKLKNLANKGNDVQTLKAIQQISGRPDAAQQYAKIMQSRDAGEGRQRGYDVSNLINSVKSGNYESPVLLKLATGTYVIGGRTRLYAALALGIPAKVKIISMSTFAKQGVSEGLEQKYLWHGSRQKINMLEPRQSVDTGGAAGSNQNAIYATSDPKVAIAMGLTTPGSNTGMFPNDPQMVLFKGNIRRGENVYLHKVPFNGPDGKPQFVQGGNSREFHSISGVKSIKPVEIKAVPVDKYLNLIRQATPADLELQKKYMKQGVAEGQLDETTPEAIAKIDGLTR